MEKNASYSCRVQGEKKECSNRVKVEYQLNSAGRNRELRYKRLIRAKTYWLIIRVWKAFLFGLAGSPVEIEAQDTKYPEDLPEEDRWDFDTLYLDVLPDTLDGLWSWSEVANYDPDADGLSNSQESTLGSNANKWDSDGDGLSDRFEFEKKGELGTNLLCNDPPEIPASIERQIASKPSSPPLIPMWDGRAGARIAGEIEDFLMNGGSRTS